MRLTLERLKTKVGKIFRNKYKDAKVYIWSGQWGSYWRPNRAGYTYNKSDAGIYTLDDAYDASGHCGPEKHIEYEFVR